MDYIQYCRQHEADENELDAASHAFEKLREEYDRTPIGDRSPLEPVLKEATDRVESARSDLTGLEREYPAYEAARQDGMTSEQVHEGQGVSSNLEALREGLEGIKDIARSYAAAAAIGGAMATHPIDVPLDGTYITDSPIQLEERAPEMPDLEEAFANMARRPEEMAEAITAAYEEMSQADQDVTAAYQNAVSSSASGFDAMLSQYRLEVASGVAQHGNWDQAVDEAQENLYARLTGTNFEGAREDLSQSVDEAIEHEYGTSCRETFEQVSQRTPAAHELSEERSHSVTY
jgi:flagellar biosynthesis chaperone FliJ